MDGRPNPRSRSRGATFTAWTCAVLAFIATVALALTPVRSGDVALVNVLLVLLAAVLQGISLHIFNRSGHADPAHVRSAVRRLSRLAGKARDARELAEKAYETMTASQAQKATGVLSAELSYLEEGYIDGAEDWAEFHPDAFRQLNEEEKK